MEIDPPGFALESFDVTGAWRDHYRGIRDGSRRAVDGPPVNSSGVLPDGRQFENIDDYKKILLENKDQLARNLTAKLVAYSTGAPPTPLDDPEIDSIVSRVREKDYGFRSLVHEIVQSALFQSK